MIVRWIALVLAPYGFVPLLGVLAIAPSLVLWSVLSDNGLSNKLSTSQFAAGVALAAGVSMAAFYIGYTVGLRMIRRRLDFLSSYLSDPGTG